MICNDYHNSHHFISITNSMSSFGTIIHKTIIHSCVENQSSNRSCVELIILFKNYLRFILFAWNFEEANAKGESLVTQTLPTLALATWPLESLCCSKNYFIRRILTTPMYMPVLQAETMHLRAKYTWAQIPAPTTF